MRIYLTIHTSAEVLEEDILKIIQSTSDFQHSNITIDRNIGARFDVDVFADSLQDHARTRSALKDIIDFCI